MFTRRHLLYAGTAAAALGILRLARPHVASAEGRAYEVTHSDDEWRKLLTPEQFNVQRAGERAPQRYFRLRRLRSAAVLVQDQIRKRHRLAEFLGAAGARGGRERGPLVRHDPHRRIVPSLRRSSRPRLHRRSEADRAALLHERRRVEVHVSGGGVQLELSFSPTIFATRHPSP